MKYGAQVTVFKEVNNLLPFESNKFESDTKRDILKDVKRTVDAALKDETTKNIHVTILVK